MLTRREFQLQRRQKKGKDIEAHEKQYFPTQQLRPTETWNRGSADFHKQNLCMLIT